MGRIAMVACGVLGGWTPVHAACPAANQFVFSFATAPAASLSYTGSSTYTATNGLGQSVSFTVSFAANGLSSSQVSGTQMPAITALINDGGTTNRNLMIGGVFSARTASITSGVRTIATTLTFATTVRDVEVQVNDVDFAANQYRDWFQASGRLGAASYVPGIVTPFGQNNGAGAKSNASSTLTLGATTTPFAISSSEAVGTSTSGNNANNGTLTASWGEPITVATLIYGNAPLTGTETVTGQQGIGIQTVRFCPMPNVTIAKSSRPWSDPVNATTNPKLIPGADVVYTLTVTNANTSPADSPVLTDVLPTNLTFYNGDIDDGGAATTNFLFNAGSSGLTFAAGNLLYSNNGGTSYGYAPASGYDANVSALRFAPSGSMAPNSSFTLSFRARIK